MGKNTVKKFAIGAGIAAAAGYIAGILTAPKSGKETRHDVKDFADKGLSEAEKELKKLQDQLGDIIDQAKSKASSASGAASKEFDELVETAKKSKDKVSGMLAGFRNDKGADKELKKAIADANNAIEHLKNYLSK